MKLVIVIECDDPDASADIARLLQKAPKDFNGLGHAFIEMSWNESSPTGKRPGSSVKSWWWGREE
jgi:hypothetical protein